MIFEFSDTDNKCHLFADTERRSFSCPEDDRETVRGAIFVFVNDPAVLEDQLILEGWQEEPIEQLREEGRSR